MKKFITRSRKITFAFILIFLFFFQVAGEQAIIDISSLFGFSKTNSENRMLSFLDKSLFDHSLPLAHAQQATPDADFSTSKKEFTDENGELVRPGDNLLFKISVSNTGIQTVNSVRVTDDIPSHLKNLQLVSIPQGATNDSTYDGTGAFGNGFLDVSNITVGSGSTVSIDFRAQVKEDTRHGTSIINKANIMPPLMFQSAAATPEVSLLVRSNSATSDVAFSKEVIDLNGGTFFWNEALEYRIKLINNTGATLENTTISDRLDTSVTAYKIASIKVNGVTQTDNQDQDFASASSDSLSFNLGNIQSGTTYDISFQVIGGSGHGQGTPVKNKAVMSFLGGSKESNETFIQMYVPPTPEPEEVRMYGGGSDRPYPGTYPSQPSTPAPVPATPTPTPSPIVIEDCDCEKEPIYYEAINQCLMYDPSRPVSFDDVTDKTTNFNYIDALKKTKFLGANEFLLEGARKISDRNGRESFKFDPRGLVERHEVVRLALLSNCLSIENSIRQSEVPYTFKDLVLNSGNPKTDKIARIMYTALKYGIVFGYPDLTARPYGKISGAEALVILSRAAKALPWDYESRGKTWYGKYASFASDRKIVDTGFNFQFPLVRQNLVKMLFKVMSYNPDPRIYGYIDQIDLSNKRFLSKETVYKPLKSQTPKCEQKCSVLPTSLVTQRTQAEIKAKREAQLENACLEHKFDRNLRFSDMSIADWGYTAINFFKNTRIKELGDFIFSGHGNHSTGKQQEKFRKGQWEFQPERFASRLEVVKTALVANCIPIEDEIPQTQKIFKDLKPVMKPGDDLGNFEKRVFYTALKRGIIGGFIDGSARPDAPVNRAEALAIYLRTAKALPSDYSPEKNLFADISNNAWYYPYVAFATQTGLINLGQEKLFRPERQIIRGEMAQMLLRSLFVSTDDKIRDYAEGSIEKLPSEYIWYAFHKLMVAMGNKVNM